MATTHYHYIISGAGCAGLSLLMRMMDDPYFQDKQIVVVDQSPKNQNDRTWCFWEKDPGLFEPIVHHRWNKVKFLSDQFSATLSLDPYQYKMIQGIDFYRTVLTRAASFSNISFKYEKVLAITTYKDFASVQFDQEVISADYIFNSIHFPDTPKQVATNKHSHALLQHFKGWVIESQQPSFDAAIATMMDFRTSQHHGTAFFYVMPLTSNKALVEYTLFSEALLLDEAYTIALNNYIHTDLNIADFEIIHEEFGIIPMTNKKFPLQNQRIVQMGLAGGQVKGSSGYAFQFIQKRTASIINSIKKGNNSFNFVSFNQRKGQFYDSVLLHVLANKKLPGMQIFADIFSKNTPQKIFRFLDNESNLLEDLQIMHAVPTKTFLPAAFNEMAL